MTDKCKFCGAEMKATKFDTNYYGCGSTYRIEEDAWWQGWGCMSRKIAALEAEVKQLRGEDDTPPIDERLAAAGKIIRELVAEREELRREVERLRSEVEEYDFTFDLHHKAEMRGIKQWQKDTGRALTLPDTAKFTVWLIERLDALGGLDSETSASE